VFGAGLLYWGNRFKNTRRTTIIRYGIFGGAALVASVIPARQGNRVKASRGDEACEEIVVPGGDFAPKA